MTYSTTAARYMGEHVSERQEETARVRAARLGGALEIRPAGYMLRLGTRRGVFHEWAQVLRLLADAERGSE